MPVPLYQRAYRLVRYNRFCRPGMDFLSTRFLRRVSRLLNIRHEQELFLLGHMRSGSSLLSAILTAHADINGYGEAKVVYREPQDILTLSGKIAIVQMLNGHRSVRRSRYIYDKILHRRLLPSTDMLVAPGTKLIFLHREPEATLRSIVGSLGWTLGNASDYLIHQYTFLNLLSKQVAPYDNAIVVSYPDIIHQSEAVLDSLTTWLGLDPALEQVFNPRKISKIVGSGDNSKRLEAGRILQEQRRHEVDLSDAPLQELSERYHDMVDSLNEHITGWEEIRVQPRPQGSSRC